MACPFSAEDLSAYIDGELPPEQASRLQAHLSDCADCRRLVAGFGAIASAARSRAAVELPTHAGGVLRAALDREAPPLREVGCREAPELLCAYFDGELDTDEAAAVEVHAFACESCYQEYRAYGRLIGVAGSRPPVEAPPELSARISAALDAVDQRRPWLGRVAEALRFRPVLLPVAGAAVAAAVLFGVFWSPPARDVPGSSAIVAVPEESGLEALPAPEAEPSQPDAEPAVPAPPDPRPAPRPIRVAERVIATPEPAETEAPADGAPAPEVEPASRPEGTGPAGPGESAPEEAVVALPRAVGVAETRMTAQPAFASAVVPTPVAAGAMLASVEEMAVTMPGPVTPGPDVSNERPPRIALAALEGTRPAPPLSMPKPAAGVALTDREAFAARNEAYRRFADGLRRDGRAMNEPRKLVWRLPGPTFN